MPCAPGRCLKESIIAAEKTLSWSYVEEFLPESRTIAQVRHEANQAGLKTVSPGTGATLRMLAAAIGARSVLEIGTGLGVSTLWCLSGMPTDGVLTTIDLQSEYHKFARAALASAEIAPTRVRFINGRALDVLPRMAAGAYDMAIIDADPMETQAYCGQMENILRTGGTLVLCHALAGDNVADPARREENTVAMRETLKYLRGSERWIVNLLGVGDGLATAVRTAEK